MQTVYRLPPTLAADLDELRERTERFKAGEISPAQYRSFRVPQGIYEQRRDGTFMLRVRLPAGAVLPDQMRALATVARKHGSGLLHVTTRQDIQVHDVSLDGIHPALVELYAAGLSTKGGGGNTVRNITACPDAGVCAKEVFDVAPYAVALTEFLLPDPLNYQLPRKYKIAFSGCSEDCIAALVNDLGLVAREGSDGPGFAVYAGGGMGARSRVGQLLDELVPADEIHLVAEAVKRVFDKHGNRKNRNRARLRFLIEEKGFARFKELYAAELAQLRKQPPTCPDFRGPLSNVRSIDPRHARKDARPPAEGYDRWRARNAVAQKQQGYYLVHVPLFLGRVDADTFEKLAGVTETRGEGVVRATPSQNLVFRWIPQAELPELHRELSALGLGEAPQPVIRELIACTGAATCRLGICLSRGLARAVREELDRAEINLEDARAFRLHINGCPNSCGRHPIASIGLAGAARRANGRLVPTYIVQLGGRIGEGRTRLAEGNMSVPARSVPAFLVELVRAFRESEHYPDFDTFLDAGGVEEAGRLAVRHKEVPPFTRDRNYYYDWEAEEPFSLAGRGPGECSAGVFDLIRVDLASAREALEAGRLFAATELAARAMLVTQGEESKNAAQTFRLFEQHFLGPGLVDASFRGLIENAERSAQPQAARDAFVVEPEKVAALIAAVERLYENMDQSLRFHVATSKPAQAEPPAPEGAKVDREADFRGVTCPLNYVKTKLLLNQMRQGQVLAVLLDDEGGRSVPESAEKDGHHVLSKQKEGNRWRVIIRKG